MIQLFGETKIFGKRKNVLYIFITFVPHDDHRDLQTIVSPSALRGTLGRAHFSLENCLSQPDGFFEGLPTVHAEHHDEEIPCEIGYRVETIVSIVVCSNTWRVFIFKTLNINPVELM